MVIFIHLFIEKSSDRNTVLRADSFHPSHLIDNIPLGQFQRLRRLCDSDADFEQQASDMYSRFQQRGYNHGTLERAYSKVRSMNRTSLLQKNVRPSHERQIYFSTQYSTRCYEIGNIIKKNWDILHSDPHLRTVFPDPPAFCFRRAPNLKDQLVRSYLSLPRPSTWLQRPRGTFSCGSCNHCPNIDRSGSFTDVWTGKSVFLRGYANCNTCFVVYRLECECGCFLCWTD